MSVNLTLAEWLRIQQAAAKQFGSEILSRAEIVRRYTLAGVTALEQVPKGERARLAHGFRTSMQAGEERRRD